MGKSLLLLMVAIVGYLGVLRMYEVGRDFLFMRMGAMECHKGREEKQNTKIPSSARNVSYTRGRLAVICLDGGMRETRLKQQLAKDERKDRIAVVPPEERVDVMSWRSISVRPPAVSM